MAVLKYKDNEGNVKTVGYIATPAEPVYSSFVLSASNWVGSTYSFESTYPSSSYHVEVESLATSVEEFEAYGAAMMDGSATSNVLTALGEVPTIDLPIKLTITSIASVGEVVVDYTMAAANWVDGEYSFEDIYPHASYTVSLEVSDKATAEEFEAFGEAMVVGATDRNVAKALGNTPTIDVEVMLKVVGR